MILFGCPSPMIRSTNAMAVIASAHSQDVSRSAGNLAASRAATSGLGGVAGASVPGLGAESVADTPRS